MAQRTSCVLRRIWAPRTIVCFRGKAKTARKKPQVTDTPKDYVYFLHNHTVPLHSFDEAVAVLKAYSFDEDGETVTMCMKCQGLDKDIPSFRGPLILPKPFGVRKKVLVFAEGDAAEAAKNAGAEIVGGEELIPQVENMELEFDHCLASLEMADKIKHLQKVLREKMPHTRRGSITDNLEHAIQTFKHTRVYKTDEYGYVNTGIGLLSFPLDDLRQNADTVINAVQTHRRSHKGEFIRKISLTSTYGPGLRLFHAELIPSLRAKAKS